MYGIVHVHVHVHAMLMLMLMLILTLQGLKLPWRKCLGRVSPGQTHPYPYVPVNREDTLTVFYFNGPATGADDRQTDRQKQVKIHDTAVECWADIPDVMKRHR
jgi:hypothetical protein